MLVRIPKAIDTLHKKHEMARPSECIPPPVGSPNPIIWHMDIGDHLRLRDLKYGANQQLYVTCGPQVADACGCHKVKMSMLGGDVYMKGRLGTGARLAVPHHETINTNYKNINLVCKQTC